MSGKRRRFRKLWIKRKSKIGLSPEIRIVVSMEKPENFFETITVRLQGCVVSSSAYRT
jgi:hypothetical protein